MPVTVRLGDALVVVGDGRIDVRDHWNLAPRSWGLAASDPALAQVIDALGRDRVDADPRDVLVPAAARLLAHAWRPSTLAPELLPRQLWLGLDRTSVSSAARVMFGDKGIHRPVMAALADAVTDRLSPRTPQIAFATLLADRLTVDQIGGLLRYVPPRLPTAAGWHGNTWDDLDRLFHRDGFSATRALRLSTDALADAAQMYRLAGVAADHARIDGGPERVDLVLTGTRDLHDPRRRVHLALADVQRTDPLRVPAWMLALEGMEFDGACLVLARSIGDLRRWGALRRDCLGGDDCVELAVEGESVFVGLEVKDAVVPGAPSVVAEVAVLDGDPMIVNCLAIGNEPVARSVRRKLLAAVTAAHDRHHRPPPALLAVDGLRNSLPATCQEATAAISSLVISGLLPGLPPGIRRTLAMVELGDAAAVARLRELVDEHNGRPLEKNVAPAPKGAGAT